jgi:hypothetical protein
VEVGTRGFCQEDIWSEAILNDQEEVTSELEGDWEEKLSRNKDTCVRN